MIYTTTESNLTQIYPLIMKHYRKARELAKLDIFMYIRYSGHTNQLDVSLHKYSNSKYYFNATVYLEEKERSSSFINFEPIGDVLGNLRKVIDGLIKRKIA